MIRPALVVLLCTLAGCRGKSTTGPCLSDDECAAPAVCCSSKCVDVQSSTANCGGCGKVCGSRHAAPRCVAGACQLLCGSGFGNCNGVAKDGCETALVSSAENCGACGNVCQHPNATSVCDRSQCEQSSCRSGFGDCNLSSSDGCEVSLSFSLEHCGACGRKCEILNGSPLCRSGVCAVAGCDAGFGDCDADAKTGCETDLSNTAAHCSACGMACDPGLKCQAGRCIAPELIFFGGLPDPFGDTPTAQVSSFNIDTHAWSKVTTAGTSPGPRAGHVAVWDDVGQQMLVWGGYKASFVLADNLVWSLDYSGAQPTWKKLVVTGGPPTARALMGWAWDKARRRLYVFAGGDYYSSGIATKELWQLDVAQLTWTRRADLNGPGPRFYPSMVWDSSSQVALAGLGSNDFDSPLPGLWTFDPSSTDGGGWSPSAAANLPTARTAAYFLGDAQPLQLWGGIDDNYSPYTDLYRLDALDAGASWTLVQQSTHPSAREYQFATSAGVRRFIFGGMDGVSGDPLSDVWELSEDAGWTRADDGGTLAVHPGAALGTVVARE